MIEVHLIGYTADLEHLVLDLDGGAQGRYRLVVDADLFATVDQLRDERRGAGLPVGDPEEYLTADEIAALRAAEAEAAEQELRARAAAAAPAIEPAPAAAGDDEVWDDPFDDLWEDVSDDVSEDPVVVDEPDEPGRYEPLFDARPEVVSRDVRVVPAPAPEPEPERRPERWPESERPPEREAPRDPAPAPDPPPAARTPEPTPEPAPPRPRTQPEPAPRPDPARRPDPAPRPDPVRTEPARRPSAPPPQQPQLSPAQIQAQLRAGRSPRTVARDAGTDIAWIERWLRPIEAERNRILDRAHVKRLERPRLGPSRDPLRSAVERNLRGKGVEPDEITWEVARRNDGRWKVSAKFTQRGRARTATWTYDPTDDALKGASELARDLGYTRAGSSGPAPTSSSKATRSSKAKAKPSSKASRSSKAKAKPSSKSPRSSKATSSSKATPSPEAPASSPTASSSRNGSSSGATRPSKAAAAPEADAAPDPQERAPGASSSR